ncbi:hypothetical protein Chor_013009 [Crotalus horridus]
MLIPRLRWVRHLPIASSVLMLLLSVFWGTGIGDHFVLSPSLLSSPLQAFRLVTYCLGHANAPLLAASLLFFPPLSWRLELQQGTLCYLRTTALSAAVSALVYLFLAGLWGVEAQTTISGYIPVHLALLGCHGRRSEWLPVALSAGLLFGLGEILSPRSPFLLHLSGLLTGLACILSKQVGFEAGKWEEKGPLYDPYGKGHSRTPVAPESLAALPELKRIC